MPYIEHKFGKTYYQQRGSKRASGLPLVCLHGGPGGHSRYMTGLFELADERQVFIYDQVGGGRSSATEKSRWTVSTFVKELQILIEAWELDEFHLFGASWGTTLALEYYLARKRSKVRSIVFQSPMFSAKDWENDAKRLIRGMSAEDQKVIRYCHEVGATDSKVYQEVLERYYAKHVCRNRAKLKRSFTTPNPNGAKVYEYMWGPSEFRAAGTLANYDKVDRLGDVACPTLFITGEHDEAQPTTARRYAKKIPDSGFVEIKDASHAILAERPRQLLANIRQFVRRHD